MEPLCNVMYRLFFMFLTMGKATTYFKLREQYNPDHYHTLACAKHRAQAGLLHGSSFPVLRGDLCILGRSLRAPLEQSFSVVITKTNGGLSSAIYGTHNEYIYKGKHGRWGHSRRVQVTMSGEATNPVRCVRVEGIGAHDGEHVLEKEREGVRKNAPEGSEEITDSIVWFPELGREG